MTRVLLTAAICAIALPLSSTARDPQSAAHEIQLQFGDLLFADGRYEDAADAYRRAASASDATAARRGGAGLVLSLLRTGDFRAALREAAALRTAHQQHALVAAVHGDALWASGLFDEAEASFEAALASDAATARARHGRARALAAKGRLDEAMSEAQEALRLAPGDGETHYTVASIYERMRRYEEAAGAFASYVNLLPNRDRSEKAAWARAEIRFLRSFTGRTPVALSTTAPVTVPIRIVDDKVLVQVRVNGGRPREFVLDTGAEQTVVSLPLARDRGIAPITYMRSAGVGQIGARSLQVGRIDALEIGPLRIENVPCLIKNPPLDGLPTREPESLSPLALGLSMRVDYARRELVLGRGISEAHYTSELPLRMHRLAMVRGTVNGTHPATFVVDTGGEAISISQSTAGLIEPATPFRKIPLKVYGTSGWDKDAFLMPNVDLEFSSIRVTRIPVVVLNLHAPSALLGFELGGIVGHKFLSKYRVTIDLDRAVVGLDAN